MSLGRKVTTKIIRLVRLPRLMKLIDISRFNRLLKSLFDSNSQEDRITVQYIVMYIYKVFRLFIIAIIITYFTGCVWFLSADISRETRELSFIEHFDLD